MKRWLLSLQLTSKIVLLVVLMGLAYGLTSLYAGVHMMQIDQQYRGLLDQQARVVDNIGVARQALSDTHTLVQAVLSAQQEIDILMIQEQLQSHYRVFNTALKAMYSLMPEQTSELDLALHRAAHTFDVAQQIIQESLGWREDRAHALMQSSFTPSIHEARTKVQQLQSHADRRFQERSHEITGTTGQTIVVVWFLGWLILVLVTAMAGWMAWRYIAMPIIQLSVSMQRLAQQDWTVPIHGQHRHDEVGTMAKTLQNFRDRLHQAQHLKQAMEDHQQIQLLSSQLLELTSALPGAVFQIQISPLGELQLLFTSPQWAERMGLDDQSALNDAGRLVRSHFEASAQKLEAVDFVLPIPRSDGSNRWIRTLANARRSADGGATFNGVWLDVTQEIEQAKALEASHRQAKHSAQEKSLLLASISHEIRTPLNAILGLAQLMRKTPLADPQQQERLNHLWQAGQHLRGIVNEVLDFSQIDAGQMRLENTHFSLRQVIQDVLRMCQQSAAAKGLELTAQVSDEIPDALCGDPHRIAQVLLNYLSNAIKFTDQGRVTVSASLAADSTHLRPLLELSVQDTGPGIPEEQQSLLFSPFQQADCSIARRYGGSGLGLHICHRLAQLMGGSTGFRSQPGQGSCFWLIAPLELAQSANAADVLMQEAADGSEWKGRRILVVDDHPLNRAVVQGMLEAHGVIVEHAEDGQEALNRLEALSDPHYYKLVLMDIQMPGMDGWTATRRIRQNPVLAHLPVLAMTANSALCDLSRSKDAGMNGHLVKPLMESTLWHALSSSLSSSDQTPEQRPDTSTLDDWDPGALAELQACLPKNRPH